MKIAIGMREDNKVNEDHFGQSRFYSIHNYENGSLSFLENKDNPHFGIDKHAKVEDIKEVVGDCKIWVAKTMGKQSRLNLIESGYKPILVNSDDLDTVLKEIKIYLMEAN